MASESLRRLVASRPSGGVRPVVVYLTNNLPIPPTSGGQLREFQLLRRLHAAFDIHLIAFTSDARAAAAHIPDASAFLASVMTIQTHPHAAAPELPHRVREHHVPDGRKIVQALVDRLRPSLVHVEGYFLLPYLPDNLVVPVVLVEENIEFDLEQSAQPFASHLGKGYSATRSWELEAWRRADRCIAVTAEDAEVIRALTHRTDVACITNGMDHVLLSSSPNPPPPASRRTFLYVANYGWGPSIDAAKHLVEDIWPLIHARSSSLRLLLAGTGMDSGFERDAASRPGVRVNGPYGEFSDMAKLASVFLFPLRFGGGVKVKLIEAIGFRMPVVTSSPALRGFPPKFREFLSVADDPSAFAEAAITALNRTDQAVRVNAAFSLLQQTLPTWDQAAEQLAEAWLGAEQVTSRPYAMHSPESMPFTK